MYQSTNNYTVIDVETTNIASGNYNEPSNRLLLTVAFNPTKGLYIKWGNEYEIGEIVDLCEQSDFIIAHNTQFDLGWLNRAGLDLHNVKTYCTQIGEYIIGGNRQFGIQASLENACKRNDIPGKDNIISKLIKGGVCPSIIPESLLQQYCVIDVLRTYQLFKKQLQQLEDNKLFPVCYTRNLISPVLVDMSFHPMLLDKEKVTKKYEEIFHEWRGLNTQLISITNGINLGSSQQLGEFLYDTMKFKEVKNHRGKVIKTPKGARATGKEVINKLTAKTDQQKEFISLYKRHALLTTKLQTLNKYKIVCEYDDCKLYLQFNQTRTVTHRTSGKGKVYVIDKKQYSVQGQNIDREFKNLFVSPSGYVFLSPDWSKLEFGVAGFMSQDQQIKEDLENGADVHRFSASIIFNKQETEVTKDERTAGKSHTFKPIYAGQSGTPDEVRYYETFRRKYKTLNDTQKGWVDEVLINKKLRIPSGLIFYWPYCQVQQSGYITYTTNIFNFPVQSFATADIAQIGLYYLWKDLQNMESYIINTVHDSMILYVKEEELDEVKEIIESIPRKVIKYLDKVYNITYNYPLELEYDEASKYWI